jgi:hypothetical protein
MSTRFCRHSLKMFLRNGYGSTFKHMTQTPDFIIHNVCRNAFRFDILFLQKKGKYNLVLREKIFVDVSHRLLVRFLYRPHIISENRRNDLVIT